MTGVADQGSGTTTVPAPTSIQTRPTIAAKERKVSLLEVELSRDRIRTMERELRLDSHAAARVRAARRARRDARLRVLRLLLAR